ncbi:DUF3365 domain-containing protein, partial [bacterium]|nr:DUF3365 domain-containing protein [bacterium]
MKDKPKPQSTSFISYFGYSTAAWTLIILILIGIGALEVRRAQHDMVRKEARANYNKDKSIRLWSVMHGGVYVPITNDTPANPFLSHVKERDIGTDTGKKLTLMNPAYMLRQTMDKYETIYGVHGHITSLKYFREETAPDEWEKTALNAFQSGVIEIEEFTALNGEPYYRFMAPMFTEANCLKCHGHQGYEIGDVRGGVSISIPLKQYRTNRNRQILMISCSLVLLWVIGFAGLKTASKNINLKTEQREHAKAELQKSHDTLEELVKERTSNLTIANKDLNNVIIKHKQTEKEYQKARNKAEAANEAKSMFLANMSHEIRTPMNGIIGMTDLVIETDLNDSQTRFVDNIKKSSDSLMVIINDILDFSKIESSDIEMKKKIFNIRESIELCLQPLIENGRTKNLHIFKTISSNVPDQLIGDPIRLNQVVINLIGNAIKFTEK